MTRPGLRIEWVPLGDVQRWPKNPKRHDEPGIAASIRRFGFADPLLFDEGTARIVAGHGRLDVLTAMQGAGEEAPDGVQVKGKRWLVPVLRGKQFKSEAEAEAFLVAHNRLVEKGGWDHEQLLEILQAHEDDTDQLALGFADGEIAALLAAARAPTDDAGDQGRPEPRPPRPFSGLRNVRIHAGDSAEVLPTLPARSFDAMVTDPPAGIGFMGREWDRPGDAPGETEGQRFRARLAAIFRECVRVLKPGAHALVWALPRTSHWTADALELAGFEIRDVVTHHFGQGFPKSHDISKAIDQHLGAERRKKRIPAAQVRNQKASGGGRDGQDGAARPYIDEARRNGFHELAGDVPVTPEAMRWRGYGTALKPATEMWILARVPLEGTVAENVLRHGTGALDVDGCRVGTDVTGWGGGPSSGFSGVLDSTEPGGRPVVGRWPANLVLTHAPGCGVRAGSESAEWRCMIGCPVVEIDRQSGWSRSPGGLVRYSQPGSPATPAGANPESGGGRRVVERFGDEGYGSRFFYVAKASREERNGGCETLTCDCQASDVEAWESADPNRSERTDATSPRRDISEAFSMEGSASYTTSSGNGDTVRSREATKSTTTMGTSSTTGSRTSSSSPPRSTSASTGVASSEMTSGGSRAEAAESSSRSTMKTGTSPVKGGPSTAGAGAATALESAKTRDCDVCGKPKTLVGHPTVKPIALMRWLIRLVCPVGGRVLDPFFGSGTTGVAGILEGVQVEGIEREAEYRAIAEARIAAAEAAQEDPTERERLAETDPGPACQV